MSRYTKQQEVLTQAGHILRGDEIPLQDPRGKLPGLEGFLGLGFRVSMLGTRATEVLGLGY